MNKDCTGWVIFSNLGIGHFVRPDGAFTDDVEQAQIFPTPQEARAQAEAYEANEPAGDYFVDAVCEGRVVR